MFFFFYFFISFFYLYHTEDKETYEKYMNTGYVCIPSPCGCMFILARDIWGGLRSNQTYLTLLNICAGLKSGASCQKLLALYDF